MVVEARLKYQPVVVMFLAVSMLVVYGCGKDTAKTMDQAIDRAVAQMEVFGGSRTVSLWGYAEPELPAGAAGKNDQQQVKQITEQQVKDFNQSLDELKTLVDQPVDDNRLAKTSAFGKSLVAAMLLYRGEMTAGQLHMLDARQGEVKDQVLVSCLDLRQFKAQQAQIKPANFDGAVMQSQNAIDAANKIREITQGQLTKVEAAIKGLKADLAKTAGERDALNAQVGKLNVKIPNVAAAEAVKIQEQVNALEKKRFDVLVQIEKFQAGPLPLPKQYQVTVGDRTLTEVSGIRQLEEEKALLETRISKAEDAAKAQATYLQNLEQQKQIAGQKGQQLAQQLDGLNARLKDDLAALGGLVSERSALIAKAEKDLTSAVRYAQQAESDLKRYLSAVNEAASGAADDNFLKEAKGVEELNYSIGNIRANAQLSLAQVKVSEIDFIQSVAPILSACQSQAALPAELEGLTKDVQADVQAKREELAKTMDGVVSQYETLYRSAGRSQLKPIVGTHLAIALYEAASAVPEKSDEYLAKAKELVGQIIAEGGAASSDPLLVPARKLQNVLGL